MMAIPATVFYFTVYDHVKYSMGYRDGDKSTKFIPILAGSVARGNYIIGPVQTQ
jgi:hypothetical protein